MALDPNTDIESVAKRIAWCGDSLDRVRKFPEAARRKVGQQLNRVQHGYEPHDWKPLTMVGAGVCEIRVHQEGEYRVLYVAKFVETVYVLHAFAKKSRKAPKRELAIASVRFRALLSSRRGLDQ